jgi:hypothetical protein
MNWTPGDGWRSSNQARQTDGEYVDHYLIQLLLWHLASLHSFLAHVKYSTLASISDDPIIVTPILALYPHRIRRGDDCDKCHRYYYYYCNYIYTDICSFVFVVFVVVGVVGPRIASVD